MSKSSVLICFLIVAVITIIAFILHWNAKEERARPSARRSRTTSIHKTVRRTSHHNPEHIQNQRELITQLPKTEQLDYSHLYKALDDLEDIINSYRADLYQEQSAVQTEIQQKIYQASTTIKRRWDEQSQRKNYNECLALHYASFTLADSIHEQCDKLGRIYISLKEQNSSLGHEIDSLSQQIDRRVGNRSSLMSQHKELCNKRHRVSQLQKIYGNNLKDCSDRLSYQNQITGQYRDFIRANFGERGRAWFARLESRKAAKR